MPHVLQAGPGKAQGLMLLDTSKGGWTILHSDSDIKRLDAKRTEGQYLWDIFSVPDVVSHMPMASCADVLLSVVVIPCNFATPN